MEVNLEFHKKDGSILYEDKHMTAQQMVALFNSQLIKWPNDDPSECVTLEGTLFDTQFNPIGNDLVVRINEL